MHTGRASLASNSASRSILLVDDDLLFADATATLLPARGFSVETACSLRDAERLRPASFDCVIVDHRATRRKLARARVAALAVAHSRRPISANPGVEREVTAARLTISGFLAKPLEIGSLVGALALDRLPVPELLPTLQTRAGFLRQLARSGCPALITGHSGSGKGRLARTIHDLNPTAGSLWP